MLRFDLEDGLIGTGQPTTEELQGLANEGVKTLINLRREGESTLPADWQAQVEAAGIRYVWMPIAGAPDVNETKARALAEVLKGAERPVAIQCGSSNRVGALLALKAKLIDGKSTEEAIAYGKNGGLADLEPHVRSVLEG